MKTHNILTGINFALHNNGLNLFLNITLIISSNAMRFYVSTKGLKILFLFSHSIARILLIVIRHSYSHIFLTMTTLFNDYIYVYCKPFFFIIF